MHPAATITHLPPTPREDIPTRWQSLVFRGKVTLLQIHRVWHDRVSGKPRRLKQQPVVPGSHNLIEVRCALYGSNLPAEFALQSGKVQNLRVAARHLHGVVIPAGETFSFWAHVPRPTRRQGFALGRELREGCVIPNIGGGLCQLSNALYDAALQAQFEIVERHAHSRRLPGSAALVGRDATVFWNYVDLRFRPLADTQLEVRLTRDELIVRFHTLAKIFAVPQGQTSLQPTASPIEDHSVESCETCGVADCFRRPSATSLAGQSHTAWLLDAYQPEFDTYLKTHANKNDAQFVPLDSRRFKLGSYRWSRVGKVFQAPWTVLRRSLVSRKLAAQGAARQRALLKMDAELAESFAKRLPTFATHVVVSQNLLPFLWQRGDLGGRTFDVLMTRLPMRELQRTLDRAAAAHPNSATLADFRAPADLVQAETEALAAARHWITPHSAIARLAGSRAVKLAWELPKVSAMVRGPWIVFPASTLGRKGAWELRSVAEEMNLPIRLCGPVLEQPIFWCGVRTEKASEDWLIGAKAVVLPAWVEHQSRRLLRAVAAGVPVIASEACGLEGVPGVITIPAGNEAALRKALQSLDGPIRRIEERQSVLAA